MSGNEHCVKRYSIMNEDQTMQLAPEPVIPENKYVIRPDGSVRCVNFSFLHVTQPVSLWPITEWHTDPNGGPGEWVLTGYQVAVQYSRKFMLDEPTSGDIISWRDPNQI